MQIIGASQALPANWEMAVGGADLRSGSSSQKKLIITRNRAAAKAFRELLRSSGGVGYAPLARWNVPTALMEVGVEPCYALSHVASKNEDFCSSAKGKDVRWVETGREEALFLLKNAVPAASHAGWEDTAILHNSAGARCSKNGGSGSCREIKPPAAATWRLRTMPEVFWSADCAGEGAHKKKVNEHRNPVEDVVSYQAMVGDVVSTVSGASTEIQSKTTSCRVRRW